jgi:spore coat polysaccharide biosynthesis protein SpsF (cytidylyltransferase family)
MLKYIVALILSLTLLAIPTHSQSRADLANALQVQRLAAERETANDHSSSDTQKRFEQAAINRVIAERQAQLRIDTEKLVALTAELKQHVDKNGANILSMDVIKKAQEIQKLAKSVQEKMKNAY